jgi:hypothetical protein
MDRVVHNVPVMDEFVIKTKRKPTGAAAMGPGPGRPKGCPNKTPTQLREMILRALDGAGGQKYLESVAKSHPQAFVSLIGKVLPTTLEGQVSHTINWPVGVPLIES